MSFLFKKEPKFNSFTEKVLALLILMLFVALILIRTNPLDYLPNRDSGSFLYAGDQILQGNLPYIDFWDSKGPGIFYINALGLWLGKNTRWGNLADRISLFNNFIFSCTYWDYSQMGKRCGTICQHSLAL